MAITTAAHGLLCKEITDQGTSQQRFGVRRILLFGGKRRRKNLLPSVLLRCTTKNSLEQAFSNWDKLAQEKALRNW